MSDSELLEMAYTIMERIKLQHGISLDSYTGARLHEWLRRYKNRPTSVQSDVCPACLGNKQILVEGSWRDCFWCNGTGKCR